MCSNSDMSSIVRWLSKFNVTGRTKVPNLSWSFFSTYFLILTMEPIGSVTIFQDGGQNPRWPPEKKGNVIYLAVKIKNEQMSSSFQFQMLPRDQDQHLSEIAHETHR